MYTSILIYISGSSNSTLGDNAKVRHVSFFYYLHRVQSPVEYVPSVASTTMHFCFPSNSVLVQANWDMTDSMQSPTPNPSYTYDTYLICMGPYYWDQAYCPS